MIWYDSQTCPDMSRHVIMILMRFDTILKTCLILFRINMIGIDTIRKYFKTWRNTRKLSKWHKEVPTDNKAISWTALTSERSKIEMYQFTKCLKTYGNEFIIKRTLMCIVLVKLGPILRPGGISMQKSFPK